MGTTFPSFGLLAGAFCAGAAATAAVTTDKPVKFDVSLNIEIPRLAGSDLGIGKWLGTAPMAFSKQFSVAVLGAHGGKKS